MKPKCSSGRRYSNRSINTGEWISTLVWIVSGHTSKPTAERPIRYVLLNPSPEDKLTGEQLRETAKEYMERMGYGDQPYIVFKHNDISREHLHLVSLRVDENGHKLSHDFETE